MVEGGVTPLLSPGELHALGFDLIVTPVAALLASAHAIRDVYAELRRTGTTEGSSATGCSRSPSSTR
jgi:2-methylisocitrate lyase-like PEP mutase family enzyme